MNILSPVSEPKEERDYSILLTIADFMSNHENIQSCIWTWSFSDWYLFSQVRRGSVPSTHRGQGTTSRHGMQMVADLGAAAVEVESDSTLALAALRQKEQDYCVFGLIYFMMARLRSNAIVHCACEGDGRPTRLCIETLQSHSQHRRSSYSLTAPEEDAVEKRMILLYQILMENGLEQAFMFRNFLAGKRDTSDGVHRSFFTLNSQDKVWYMLPVQGGWLFCYRFYRKITSTVEQ
ncbi:uncharacterized protein LOC108868466 isoform X2 [Pyrus x bretschneideri]|uniref:uncharacterized protein LOC108868466 isoform X2 n=1 Tax=Pyrus x bretschneideri TaxID=225117 RepID=UPI00202F1272|nr:uncharacterized protein LOC108868466 isoform X2 [Pyrus x bretschneideri]